MDSRKTEKPVKDSQAETDASIVAQPNNMRGDNSTDTKSRPRRKLNKPTTEVGPLTVTLRPNKNNRKLQTTLHKNFALPDTGAKRSALFENETRRVIAVHPSAMLDDLPAPDYRIEFANGNLVPIRKQVLLRFS